MIQSGILSRTKKTLTVGDSVSREILCCHFATPICDAVRMMWESELSSIVIVFEGMVEGIWTEADALKYASFDRLSKDPIYFEVRPARYRFLSENVE